MVPIPKAAKTIHFTLKAVDIKGMTAFTPEQMTRYLRRSFHRQGSETLEIAWMIAGSITERYDDAGYFLSRTYVPAQTSKWCYYHHGH